MRNGMATLAGMVRKGLPIPLGSATEPRHYISIRNLCDLVETILGSDDDRWAKAAGHIFEPSDGQAVATRDLIRMMVDAIDRLDVAPVGELEAAFGWRPVERMPESLAFLREEVSPS